MTFREELQPLLGKQFLFEAKLTRNGRKSNNSLNTTMELLDISNDLMKNVVFRIYPGQYLHTPVHKENGKTTLLTNIKIGEIEIDHIWIDYDLILYKYANVTRKYIGQLYTYSRQDGLMDYGIEILGVLDK